MTDTNLIPFPRHIVGTWTASSSIVHGGDETLGTTKLFRSKGWIHDKRKIRMPMISGNAIRGIWRRACAMEFLDLYLEAGGTPLSLSAFYYLTSGGALHKGSAGSALDIVQEGDLRTLIPHVGLFGGAGLGKIQEGKLYIDEAIPICRETVGALARIWPAVEEAATADISIRDLTEVHGYSRQDDAKNAHWRRYLQPTDREAVEKALEAKDDDIAAAAGTPQQMRYEQQELVAGTVFFHGWGLRWRPTNDELAGLGAGLLRWASRPSVGGRNAVGHGNILPEYHGARTETKLLGDGSKPLAELAGRTPRDVLRDHIASYKDAIADVLGAL